MVIFRGLVGTARWVAGLVWSSQVSPEQMSWKNFIRTFKEFSGYLHAANLEFASRLNAVRELGV